MNPYFTKNPIVGTPLTPSVIRQINTAVRRYMPIAGNGIRTTITAGGTIISAIPAPAPKKADVEFLHPFEVRWSATARNKQGAWVIWLPDDSSLVYVGNAYVPQIANIVAEAALPAGWYRMSHISATATAVWLIIRTSTLTGAVRVYPSESPEQPQTGYTISSILVATMTRDAQTGSWSVKQFIDSAITFGGGGGGGSVALDDVSLDWNSNDEAQIKDWDTGTPESPTTIAQDIHDGSVTAQNSVVSRTTGAALQYKQPGTLAQLLGSTVSRSSQKILTGLRWDTSSHRLVISSANITVANGVITSWTDNNDENIDSVSIKDIINQ